ncbi:MAG: hypothetical protein K0S74_1575 [Chlamydiales bacterium]|jgi:hypothetical protein|nr:hypothetical protein [Chlamydiales bacterium]
MQTGHHLEFECEDCCELVGFSVIKNPTKNKIITCKHCSKQYAFAENALQKLHLFEALCKQIHLSQEILSQACVAVDMGEKHVEIPFNLLLTRLNSVLEMSMGDRKIQIVFRMNPVQEMQQA